MVFSSKNINLNIFETWAYSILFPESILGEETICLPMGRKPKIHFAIAGEDRSGNETGPRSARPTLREPVLAAAF